MSTYPGLLIPSDVKTVDHPHSPLSKAILADLGSGRFHTFNQWWAVTPQSWICPACQRKKGQIAHSVARGGAHAALQDHHDHASVAAFDRTIVCIACNFADGCAKRMVEVTLPSADRVTFMAGFSFSPDDICGFVVPSPNTKSHRLDRDAALATWQRREADFRWRLNNPGTEELPPGLRLAPARPGVTTAEVLTAADAALSTMVDPRTGAILNASSWRYLAIGRRSGRLQRPPNKEEIERAVLKKPQHIDEDWVCPCCVRPLRDTVIYNGRNPPFLRIQTCTAAGIMGPEKVDLCHSCGLLHAQLGIRRAASLGCEGPHSPSTTFAVSRRRSQTSTIPTLIRTR